MNQKFRAIAVAALCVIGMMASAQETQTGYLSYFGDRITEWEICWGIPTMYQNDSIHDPRITGSLSLPIHISKTDTVTVNNTIYYKVHSEGLDDVSDTAIMNLFHYTPCGILTTHYIREDTVTGRLYRYLSHLDREFLICDMSLQPGDSMVFPFHDILMTPDAFLSGENAHCWQSIFQIEDLLSCPHESNIDLITLRVDSVSYVNGRKVIYFENSECRYKLFYNWYSMINYHIPIMFIEGVGPIYGPVGSCEECAWTEANALLPLLLCVHKDNELVYMTHEVLGCWQFIASVPENISDGFSVYPNPADNAINIRLSQKFNLTNSSLYVVDVVGNVVARLDCMTHDDTMIDISHLSPGMYIVVYESEKSLLTSRFVKH